MSRRVRRRWRYLRVLVEELGQARAAAVEQGVAAQAADPDRVEVQEQVVGRVVELAAVGQRFPGIQTDTRAR